MIGIDIVSIERFEKFLQKKGALSRYLREDEIYLAKSTQSSAGLFAAKEAVSKALQTGIGKSCSFHDIKIHKTQTGAPFFTLKKELIEAFGIIDSSLSITHDGAYVIAVAYMKSNRAQNSKLFH